MATAALAATVGIGPLAPAVRDSGARQVLAEALKVRLTDEQFRACRAICKEHRFPGELRAVPDKGAEELVRALTAYLREALA